MNTHNTRDHRFAYISHGNITQWARATTSAVRPETRTPKPSPAPVNDVSALRARHLIGPLQAAPQFVRHDSDAVIIDSNHGPAKSAVTKAMEECQRTADIGDARIESSNFFARLFHK